MKTSESQPAEDIRPQPRPEITERRFRRLMANMQGGPDQLLKMEGLSIEEKWRIINDEPALKSSLHDVKYYVHQLKGHTDPHIHMDTSVKKSSWKKSVKPLSPVREVMEDLKEDLHSAKNDFLRAFISDEAQGVQLLGKFLEQTQALVEKDRNQHQGAAPGNSSVKTSTYDRKQQKLLENIKRTTSEESAAVNCFRKIAEDERGLIVIMTIPDILENIASCIVSRSLSARLYAFMVLIATCEARDGLNRVLSCLSKFRGKIREKVRFYAIAQMVFLERNRVELVTICLRFINTLLSCTTDMNRRVYLQYELEMAEFNPIKIERLYRLDGEVPPSIKQELDAWHSRYVSIQRLQDGLSTIETRNALLRKEVDRQEDKLRDYEAENTALQTKILDMVGKSEEYRDRVNELQDTIEKLTREYTKKTGQHAEKQLKNFDKLMEPLVPESDSDDVTVVVEPLKEGDRKLERKKSVVGDKKKEIVISKPKPTAQTPPPPVPPPTPPVIPNAPPLLDNGVRKKTRITPKHPLPMLNWNTINQPGNTIFKVLDDENVFNEMDFDDFQEHFRLKEGTISTAAMERLKRIQEKHAQKLRLIATNRSKNLVITIRRIALTAKQIREHVEKCDTTGVSGEYAELLLNFLPSKEELKLLAQNAEKYENMGEAEQFMFQMARVDRYESKLRLMTFMGIYDELVITLKPEIQGIVKACDSLITSGKLKKVLEIVLAFGNFMNSSRRGPAYGFKLESLQRLTFVKSTDRSHNFLNYLVETINQCYPELKDWYEELQFEEVKSASLEALTMDIHGLRKGLELAKFERDRQMDNPIIGQFYLNAADTIHALSEGFKKMEEIYQYTCNMFGESPQHIQPGNFFKLFKTFKLQFLTAQRENVERQLVVAPKRKPAKDSPDGKQFALPQSPQSPTLPGRFGLLRRSTRKTESYVSGASSTQNSTASSRRDSPTSSDSGVALSLTSGETGSARSIPFVTMDGGTGADAEKSGGIILATQKELNKTSTGTAAVDNKASNGNFWGLYSGMK